MAIRLTLLCDGCNAIIPQHHNGKYHVLTTPYAPAQYYCEGQNCGVSPYLVLSLSEHCVTPIEIIHAMLERHRG